MGGALQAVNSFISAIKPAEDLMGVGAMIEAVEGIEATATKLIEAAKNANPAEKAQIDQKLGALAGEATKDLAQAKDLIDNAAAAGDPHALLAEANLAKMQRMHQLFEMMETLKKINQGMDTPETTRMHKQLDGMWKELRDAHVPC